MPNIFFYTCLHSYPHTCLCTSLQMHICMSMHISIDCRHVCTHVYRRTPGLCFRAKKKQHRRKKSESCCTTAGSLDPSRARMNRGLYRQTAERDGGRAGTHACGGRAHVLTQVGTHTHRLTSRAPDDPCAYGSLTPFSWILTNWYQTPLSYSSCSASM